MTVKRDEKGRVLPGQCLNKSGRPKKDKDIRQLILDKTKDLGTVFKTLLDIMNSKKASNKDRIASAKVLLEYSMGKPAQQVNATVDTTGDIVFRWADTNEEAK